MPIIDRNDDAKEELSPGVDRWALVDGSKGAVSLSVGDVVLQSGGTVPNHIHPTEEAMVIVEGQLDAVLGDETIPVTAGQTVLAPAGVRHGFVNRSGAPARVMAIFPTANMERTLVD